MQSELPIEEQHAVYRALRLRYGIFLAQLTKRGGLIDGVEHLGCEDLRRIVAMQEIVALQAIRQRRVRLLDITADLSDRKGLCLQL